jgi:hypothetical protein
MMDDYIKVDFEGLKIKLQSVHVPEGGFLLVTLPRDVGTHAEVASLVNNLGKVGFSNNVLVWRDVNMKSLARQELEDMKWRIEELLKND